MNNPKISVLIAAYNVAEFLPQCLDSVLDQTYSNFEVIIINDGSTDQTQKICEEYAKKSSLIKIINQKNQGLSAVRNIGIQKAKGNLITFVDGDDYLETTYLEKLYEGLFDQKSDISVCGYQTTQKKPTDFFSNRTISGKDATIELLTQQNNYQIVSWNKLYKKSLFDDIEFPIGKKHEDTLTTYKILSKAQKVTFINEPLYKYRQRIGSIMSEVKLNDRLNTKLLAAEEAKEYFKSNKQLYQAAEIAELLAYFAFLDNIHSGKLDIKPYFVYNWLKKNKATLSKNPFLSSKLKIYINTATTLRGTPYKIFRHIKH